MMRLLPSLLLICVLFTVARADPRESITFTSVPSDGALNAASNALRSTTFTGSYTVTRVRVSATLTKLNTSTFAREARIHVTPPTGPTFVLQPFTTGSFSGSISTSSYVFTLAAPVGPAAGLWSFRFHEAFDDTGVDSRWDTITLTLDDGVPSPPVALDLGTLRAPATLTRSYTLTPGLIQWYRLDLPDGATAAGLRYLDIDTGGSIVGAADDTEIAMYSSTGVRIAEDDDDGPGKTSMLSFGTGARTGSSLGQDGELPPGVYYLAIAGFDATFSPGFAVSTTNPSVGNIALRVVYQPTPLEVSGFSPAEAREGDLVTITGRGFGTNAANITSMVTQPDGSVVPMRTVSVSDTALVARVAAVRPSAQPGQILVWRGEGNTGNVTCGLPAVIPESPVSALDLKRGPAGTSSAGSLVLIPSPSLTPGWRYGALNAGAVTIPISSDWPQNATVRGILHLRSESGVRSHIEFPPVRLRLAGSPLLTAQRLADLLTSAYAQRLPDAFLSCEAVAVGSSAELRVRARNTAAGSPVGISFGTLDIAAVAPATVTTVSGQSVSAFGGAGVLALGSEVHMQGLGVAAGATVSASETPYGQTMIFSAIELLQGGARLTLNTWADGPRHPNEPHMTLSAVSGGFTQPLELAMVVPTHAGVLLRVQVYSAGSLVGRFDGVLSDTITATRTTGGPPGIVAAGVLSYGVPSMYLGFNAPTIIRRGADELVGDQVRFLVPGLTDILTAVEAVDLSGTNLPTLVMQDASVLLAPPRCAADFNDDGGIDGADVDAFFAAWEAGDAIADVNRDGGIDGSDPAAFFEVWEAGGCPE